MNNAAFVQLAPDQVDRLIAPHLMACLVSHTELVARGIASPDDDFVHSLLRVIEEFSTPEQFEAFMAQAPEIYGDTP